MNSDKDSFHYSTLEGGGSMLDGGGAVVMTFVNAVLGVIMQKRTIKMKLSFLLALLQ